MLDLRTCQLWTDEEWSNISKEPMSGKMKKTIPHIQPTTNLTCLNLENYSTRPTFLLSMMAIFLNKAQFSIGPAVLKKG